MGPVYMRRDSLAHWRPKPVCSASERANHAAFLFGGSCSQIPTGLSPSPTFGVQPFTQPMPRFDVLPRNAVSTLTPAPRAMSNQTQQPVDPGLVGGRTGLTGPIEGRPPGAQWAHQRFAQFPPQVAIEVTTKPVTTNTTYNPGVTSDFNSGINPASPIPAKFHPDFPTQNANRVWTFQGTFPPKLTAGPLWRTGPVPPSQWLDD